MLTLGALSTFHPDVISLTFPRPSEACATCKVAAASAALGKQSSPRPGMILRLCSCCAGVGGPEVGLIWKGND